MRLKSHFLHLQEALQHLHQILEAAHAHQRSQEEDDVAKLIALVPELCNLTGLTGQMKVDFRVMKDVAQFTRVTPNQRQQVCITVCTNLDI